MRRVFVSIFVPDGKLPLISHHYVDPEFQQRAIVGDKLANPAGYNIFATVSKCELAKVLIFPP